MLIFSGAFTNYRGSGTVGGENERHVEKPAVYFLFHDESRRLPLPRLSSVRILRVGRETSGGAAALFR